MGAHNVLVASLTRAAAQEVAGRDTGLERRSVGTLHAHAFRALKMPELAETPKGAAAWNDWCAAEGTNMQLGARYSLDPENAPPEGPGAATDGEKMLAELAVMRARMSPPDLWRSGLQRFARQWGQFKTETGRLDFSDLIEFAATDTEHAPGDPMAMFLDEAQDMSRLEMRLARAWGRRAKRLIIVGDPYQNLYDWRGSEPEVFHQLTDDATTSRVLEQSYRVPRAVHAYAVAWAQPLVPEGRSFPTYRPRDEEGRVRSSSARWRDPDTLIRDIERDLEEFEPTEHPTVMILASCGYMLEPLLGALRSSGIPFANPFRPTHGGWNPLRGADRLLAFLRPDDQTWGQDARPWTYGEVNKWIEPLTAKGVLTRGSKRLVDEICRSQGHAQALTADDQVALDRLTALFEPDAVGGVYAVDPQWWLDNLLGSRRRQFDYAERVMATQGRAALREQPRVCVGSIHSVKGGQAESVYVLPDLSRQGYWNNWTVPEQRDSIIRQFYVAATRARHTLTICQNSGPEYVPLPLPSGETEASSSARSLASRLRAQSAAGTLDVG